MGVQFANNAASTLAGSITNVATTISLATGTGALFPAATVVSGNYFYLTLIDSANNIEIVKVTDRTTDTLTVIRARDGTTARAFAANDRAELRPTAAALSELPNRQMQSADIADLAVSTSKLAIMAGLSAAVYGGAGKSAQITVNNKGQITAATNVTGYVQLDQFDYTGSSQTWNKPVGAGVIARIQLWGAGAGGGRTATGNAGGGGGGGEYQEHWVLLSELASTMTVDIGAGGAAAASDASDGSDGGNTTVVSGGITMTAYGGGRGDGTSGGNMNEGGSGGGPYGVGTGGVGAKVTWVPTGAANTSTNLAAIPSHSPWVGGGGGGGSFAGDNTYCTGASSVWGGAGGGGATDTGSGTDSIGGTSLWGGGGGRGSASIGGASPVDATSGSVPGGGGGGSEASAAGDGGHGRAIITVF